jgi:predicted transcriptional regulator
VPVGELPKLIADIYTALGQVNGATPAEVVEPQKPAVPIKKSVTSDYIVSLEDGRKFKSLKRHLSAHYGMTPNEYRAKWNLPSDYPMVAPNYAATRSALAKTMGLGRKPGEKPKSRGRKKAV